MRVFAQLRRSQEAVLDGNAGISTIDALKNALNSATKAPKVNWTLATWAAAWSKYALSAEATGQLCYASSMAHLDNMLRLADECRGDRTHVAAVFKYDELARVFRLIRGRRTRRDARILPDSAPVGAQRCT